MSYSYNKAKKQRHKGRARIKKKRNGRLSTQRLFKKE